MDLQQLKYFQTIARLENMSRAAEELYVAQPSLSRAIARLEEELGAPLFDRLGRQIHLNQLGRVFLHRVEQAFAELEAGKREVADMAGLEQGLVGLAVLYTVGAQLLPEILGAFRKDHPSIRFHLFQNGAHAMINQLRKGEIDLCISSPKPEQSDIGWAPLRTEEIFLAVSPHHRLAGRDSIYLSEVAHDPFISLKREYGLREMTDHFCQQAGFEPRITFEGDEIVMVRGLVAAELGVAFIPALALRNASEPTVSCLHISDFPCQRTIGLAWLQERYLTASVQLFRQFVIEYFANLLTL
jgi:DNA-binding transcriptional LysR family regulator